LRIWPVFLGVILIVQTATHADASDLMRLYRLALTRDTTLPAAEHQRDAAIEARPQALSQWLPQLSGTGSRTRHFITEPAASFGEEDCGRTSVTTVRCNANSTSYGLTLTQTVWSYEAYTQLKEADAQAASAAATYVSTQQDLLLRLAQAYRSDPGTAPLVGRGWTYIAAGLLATATAAGVLVTTGLHLASTAKSVDRSQLTIATVTRGTFTREVAADGQVIAAVSPTLYSTATGTVTLKVHAGDAVSKGETMAVLDSPALT
jgi:biotin carboxyl carrier protein